jgi:Tol biopolymer transport system component
MNADGSDQKPLLTSVPSNEFEFAWSPSGDKLAFTGDSQGCEEYLNRDIFMANADGTGATRLTATPPAGVPCDGAASETTPSWSPDGARIAFTRASSGYYYVSLMQADGAAPTELTAGRSPRWSPVRDVIAFVGDGGRLYRINADGSDRRPLSTGAVVPEQSVSVEDEVTLVPIAWSPDGRRVVFVSATASGDPHQIFVVNEDGSGETRLATGESPAWSPDGSQLAFVREGKLYRMSADGSAETFLADSILPGSAPAWSPSGTRLVVVKTAPQGIAEIWVLKADGTAKVRLTDPAYLDVRELVVSWRP